MSINFQAFLLNLIAYILVISPVLLIGKRKNIYTKKNTLIINLCIATLVEIIVSILFLKNSEKFFCLFSKKLGVVNTAVFISKIIFSTASLYAVKFITYFFLYYTHKNLKAYLLFKIIMTVILCIIGNAVKGIFGLYFGYTVSEVIIYIVSLCLIYLQFKKPNNYS